MQGPIAHPFRGAVALAIAFLAPAAGALEIGDIQVRSSLGEPLDASIPLALAGGEYVEGRCFSLPRPAPGSAFLPRARLWVHTSRGAKALRISTAAPVSEPALALRVRAACPGLAAPVEREYTLLLNPPRSAQRTAPRPAIAAQLDAQAGDTLASVAERVFPREPAARAKYLSALREANPAFASYREDEPLPQGMAIALPDLRTYAAARPERRPMPTAAAKAPPAAAKDAAAPAQPRVPLRPTPVLAQPAAARDPVPAPALPRAAASPFVLRLSTQADLSRSSGIDERTRAQLRERRLVLDSDDQVSALLALRHNVKQLESRVAELQLKLSSLPAAPAAPKVPAPAEAPKPVATEAPRPSAPAEAPRPVVAEAPKPVVAEAPKPSATEAPKAAAASPKPAVMEAPKAPAAESPKAVVAAQPAAPKPAPPKAAAPRADGLGFAGIPEAGWYAVLAALLALAAALAWYLRRRRAAREDGDEPTHLPEIPEPHAGPSATAPQRPSLSSDAGLSTRLAENSRELRRRYIEERFPEVANRTLDLGDPASVIKAARLFYEDGALTRAVELLQFCIEEDPAEVRLWLALFEIFRLERLAGEFAELAARFREIHGASPLWIKVQYFGREIDPDNPLYSPQPAQALETIGPAQARRAAAAAAIVDPIAENWLEAPMDFENEVLANELRQALMGQARLTEQDLAPNPMPVLRNVEMFNVA